MLFLMNEAFKGGLGIIFMLVVMLGVAVWGLTKLFTKKS